MLRANLRIAVAVAALGVAPAAAEPDPPLCPGALERRPLLAGSADPAWTAVDLAPAPDGGAAIAWAGRDASGQRGLYFARCDARGCPARPALRLASLPAGDPAPPSLALAIGRDERPRLALFAAGQARLLSCRDRDCAGHVSADLPPGPADDDGDVPPTDAAARVDVAIAADGAALISVFRARRLELVVCRDASCRGAAGERRTLDRASRRVGVGQTLAVGPDGRPALSYQDAIHHDLRLLRCGDPHCAAGNVVRLVDASGRVGAESSVAFGAEGFPVVAYSDASEGALKLAQCRDPVCDDRGVVTADGGGPVQAVRLATDALGRPWLSYGRVLDRGHFSARCADVACSGARRIERVAPLAPVAAFALDARDRPLWAVAGALIRCAEPGPTAHRSRGQRSR